MLKYVLNAGRSYGEPTGFYSDTICVFDDPNDAELYALELNEVVAKARINRVHQPEVTLEELGLIQAANEVLDMPYNHREALAILEIQKILGIPDVVFTQMIGYFDIGVLEFVIESVWSK